MLEVLARIRHRRTRRQLSPYLDGMLSAQESRRLEAHLAQCQACRDELEELRATVQAIAELPLVEAPRSFALTAAPRRVEALRPAARRTEFGLRLATAAAAFVLAVVAAGDLLGLPGGDDEENGAALQMESIRNIGVLEGTPAAGQVQPSEHKAEDKVIEAPTAPPPATGVEGSIPSPEGYGYGEDAQVTTATPEPTEPSLSDSPEAPLPGQAGAPTPAATAAPAATAPPAAPPATGPGPVETPAPATDPAPETPALTETPVPGEGPIPDFASAGTPEAVAPTVSPETPAVTATPAAVGARTSGSEPEGQPPSEADEQALAEAQRDTLAAEEGGPSRETVVRWLEIGLASGLALLFVTWILARRRGWA